MNLKVRKIDQCKGRLSIKHVMMDTSLTRVSPHAVMEMLKFTGVGVSVQIVQPGYFFKMGFIVLTNTAFVVLYHVWQWSDRSEMIKRAFPVGQDDY